MLQYPSGLQSSNLIGLIYGVVRAMAHICTYVYSILTNRVRALKSTLGQLTTPAQLFILQAMKHDKLVSAVQHYQTDFT